MARRPIRKLTVWSAEEWERVEEAARPSGVPPLRYVREATLAKAAQEGGRPGAPPRRRRVADELVHQLARVLNNLRQLHAVALDDGHDEAAALIDGVAAVATAATEAAPERAEEAAPLVALLLPAGTALNEMAHRANTAEQLPPDAELLSVLAAVEDAVRGCLP